MFENEAPSTCVLDDALCPWDHVLELDICRSTQSTVMTLMQPLRCPARPMRILIEEANLPLIWGIMPYSSLLKTTHFPHEVFNEVSYVYNESFLNRKVCRCFGCWEILEHIIADMLPNE
jgi:hypothetical protein